MATPAPVRALEYHLVVYRRTWRGSIVSSVLSPVLFLAAMGLGLGSLVDEQAPSTASLGGVDYLAFIAPGLLAATAMQTANGEASWPVLGCLKWNRTYLAQAATTLRPSDIALGHQLYVLLRILTGAAVFFVVILLFGAVDSAWGLAAIPAATLCGWAFAAPLAAFAVRRESEQGFTGIYRFLIVPMFLFSGTFYPIDQLPDVLEPIAVVTPLWHGVEVCRGFTLGTATFAGTLVHVTYLGVWVVVSLILALRAYQGRLAR